MVHQSLTLALDVPGPWDFIAIILSLFVDAKAARAVRDWAVRKLAAIELAHAGRGGRYKQATIDLLRILSQSTIADPPRTRDYGT